MSALAGRRVVITRPRPAAEEFARLLRARGATPVVFPTISVQPEEVAVVLRPAIDRLEAGDWVVLTSANASALAAPFLGGLAGAGVRIAAIGGSTATPLTGHGIAVDAIPAEPLGAAIAKALGELRGRRALVPRSASGREETLQALRDAGAEVDAVSLYHLGRTEAAADGLAELERGADAVVFTSPSTVDGFVELAGATGLRRIGAVCCIGPTTAAAARAAGVRAPLIAPDASTAGLLAILESHFAGASMPPEGPS